MTKEYNAPGVLGIVKQTDGEFRVRGFGNVHESFYNWLMGDTSVVRTGLTWPWYYFKFSDTTDAERMRTKWSEYFLADDED